jgi:hypothetical protein
MSRGFGKTEREILERLADGTGFGLLRGVSLARRSSVNRALRNLRRQGFVAEDTFGDSRIWRLTDKFYETPAGKAARERQEKQDREFEEWQRQRQRQKKGRRQRMGKPHGMGNGDGQLERLGKLLGMLGSDHAGEREAAFSQIEKLRRELDVPWVEFLQGVIK